MVCFCLGVGSGVVVDLRLCDGAAQSSSCGSDAFYNSTFAAYRPQSAGHRLVTTTRVSSGLDAN